MENNTNIENKSSALESINDNIKYLVSKEKELISDGFHSFKELYDFRMVYNAALFNEWGNKVFEIGNTGVTQINPYSVHKSWKHYDGEWCFGKEKEWFIVVAVLPTGQISNHYKAENWDLFKIPETEKALFEFDGHTSKNVLERLKSL